MPNSKPNLVPFGTPSPPENVHESVMIGMDGDATLNGEAPGRMKQPSTWLNGVSTVTTRDVSGAPVSFRKSTIQPKFTSPEVIVTICVGDIRSTTAEPGQVPVPPPPISGSSASALVVLAESIISVNKTNK